PPLPETPSGKKIRHRRHLPPSHVRSRNQSLTRPPLAFAALATKRNSWERTSKSTTVSEARSMGTIRLSTTPSSTLVRRCATSPPNPHGPDTSTNTSNNDDLDEDVCGASCNWCSSNSYARFHIMTESESYCPWDVQGYERERRGRAFVEALKTAKDGTVVQI
ncbi:unnamed protein product, partial [Ectocarpus sp. 8 AP-2014]